MTKDQENRSFQVGLGIKPSGMIPYSLIRYDTVEGLETWYHLYQTPEKPSNIHNILWYCPATIIRGFHPVIEAFPVKEETQLT